LAGTLAVFASACFHASFDLAIEDDGSGSMKGTIQVERTVTELVLKANRDIGLTFEDFCATMHIDPVGTDEPDRSVDGYASESELIVDDSGCEMTHTAEWTADHEGRFLTGLGRDGGPMVHRDNDGWRFELEMSVVREMFGLDRNADLFALVVDQPTLTVAVTLPVQAQEHNADERDGPTFRWHVVMTDIENMPDTLYASASPSDGSGAAVPLRIVVAVVAVLSFLAIAYLLRRRSARAASPSVTVPDVD